jgi:hypothetical protein
MLKHMKGKLEDYEALLLEPTPEPKGHYISINIATYMDNCTHERAQQKEFFHMRLFMAIKSKLRGFLSNLER